MKQALLFIWISATCLSYTGDHHTLSGLYRDDHPQYVRKDGTRPLQSDWNAGQYTISALGIDVTDIDFSGQLTSTVAIGTAPFVITSTTLNTNLNADLLDGSHASAFAGADAGLASLAGLTYVFPSFVKMTAADTFSLDTNTYYKSGDTATLGGLTVTGLSGIVKATAGVLENATAGTDYQSGSLTATRIPYATGAPGTLTDSANLTFDGTNLTCGGTGQFTTLGAGAAPAATKGINAILTSNSGSIYGGMFAVSGNGASPTGLNATVTSTRDTAAPTTLYGFNITSNWTPAAMVTANRTMASILPAYVATYITSPAGATKNMTVSTLTCFNNYVQLSKTFGDAGALTVTNLYHYKVSTPAVLYGSTIGTQTAFYDEGCIGATTNWGLGINTQSYINANLSVGKNTAPTAALDVTGAGLFSTTLGVTGLTTATGGIATPKGAITLAASATAIAATKSFHVITGDAGANTVATITGGSDGFILRLLFVDALVTITDTDAHTANTVDLSAAFTSADDTVLTLIFDGTSWYEVSRSVN